MNAILSNMDKGRERHSVRVIVKRNEIDRLKTAHPTSGIASYLGAKHFKPKNPVNLKLFFLINAKTK